MFGTRVSGGKAFAAQQKMREFIKVLLKSKTIQKRPGKKPGNLITKVTNNLNKTLSIKYGFTPNQTAE